MVNSYGWGRNPRLLACLRRSRIDRRRCSRFIPLLALVSCMLMGRASATDYWCFEIIREVPCFLQFDRNQICRLTIIGSLSCILRWFFCGHLPRCSCSGLRRRGASAWELFPFLLDCWKALILANLPPMDNHGAHKSSAQWPTSWGYPRRERLCMRYTNFQSRSLLSCTLRRNQRRWAARWNFGEFFCLYLLVCIFLIMTRI